MIDLNKTISTIETEKKGLEPKKVVIKEITTQKANNKEGKEIKDKFVFLCKHPEKEETIEISKVKYEKQGKLEIAGTWVSLDKEGNILKNSSVANLMRYNKTNTLKELLEKEVETTTEQNGYLVFKAY